jgi:hypothetical protein
VMDPDKVGETPIGMTPWSATGQGHDPDEEEESEREEEGEEAAKQENEAEKLPAPSPIRGRVVWRHDPPRKRGDEREI